jgi:uncharacterized membrane protein YfcA
MKSKIAFAAVSVLIIVSIYASSTMLPIFVEARKTVTNIDCWPQDGGKTRCCGSGVGVLSGWNIPGGFISLRFLASFSEYQPLNIIAQHTYCL